MSFSFVVYEDEDAPKWATAGAYVVKSCEELTDDELRDLRALLAEEKMRREGGALH